MKLLGLLEHRVVVVKTLQLVASPEVAYTKHGIDPLLLRT
jgi:hypothetical protein